ncbi:hypothetical protein QAO71_17885 (plasmid) [Halopseudomonas sp. SMJS2]|uniref:hypothetical protein n=1 Tax=Halopseudomonas sp. SMJS2 TaxID=3041098 RepID=UPI0024528765|nr:hypothetical protein [Halopseudomonas sp. SMJS2]WGK63413.1 hypothetical protein QAO71_17885 [Halopseudomonas sp. SMJS2]
MGKGNELVGYPFLPPDWVEATEPCRYVLVDETKGSHMKHQVKVQTSLFLAAFLSGCASNWINSPSQQTLNFVNDLKLEGYTCQARLSDIVCSQTTPMKQKAPALCTSDAGCVDQPGHEIRNVYYITEKGNGIPKIRHVIDRKAL